MNFTSHALSATLSQHFGRPGWLGALGVRGRLLAGFTAVALFTGGLGLFAVLAMGAVTEGEAVMYIDEFGGLDLFAQYVQQSYECRTNGLAYLLTDEPVRRQLLRDQIARRDARMRDLEAQMDAADIDRKDVDTLAGITAAWDAYAQWRDQVVLASAGESDKPGAIAGYYADGASLMNTFTDASRSLPPTKTGCCRSTGCLGDTTYELNPAAHWGSETPSTTSAAAARGTRSCRVASPRRRFAAAGVVLPMPGSPEMSTSRPRPVSAASSPSRSRDISLSRPSTATSEDS